MTRPRACLLSALALAAIAWANPARANLELRFDATSYSIAGVGQTTTIGVYIAQFAGDLPNIDASNPLFSGGIELTFPTAGAATLTGFTPSPAWLGSSAGSSTSGLDTIESLVVGSSAAGITDLSRPVLLGTFTFTGQFIGSTTVTLSTITPGINFIDGNLDDLDPTNTPSATITVAPAAVPEPGSLALLALGGACALALARPRRPRVAPLVRGSMGLAALALPTARRLGGSPGPRA